GEPLSELTLGVEPGADGGATLGQRVQLLEAEPDALAARRHLRGIAGKFLPEGERRRVLGMRAADLDDPGERRRLFLEGALGASAGSRRWLISSAAAMCMAVGKQSFDDWLMLTWSLGCTGAFAPRLPPNNSLARLAITSFMFMLVWVPEPVCQTTSGNSSS